MREWAVVSGLIDPYEGVEEPDEVLVGFSSKEEANEYARKNDRKLEYYFVCEVTHVS